MRYKRWPPVISNAEKGKQVSGSIHLKSVRTAQYCRRGRGKSDLREERVKTAPEAQTEVVGFQLGIRA